MQCNQSTVISSQMLTSSIDANQALVLVIEHFCTAKYVACNDATNNAKYNLQESEQACLFNQGGLEMAHCPALTVRVRNARANSLHSVPC